jgi:hypothetical protein
MLTRPHNDNILGGFQVANEDVFVLPPIAVLALDIALTLRSTFATTR